MKYLVKRLDENPKNIYTFNTWVTVSIFSDKKEAEAFVKRAETPRNKYKVVEESK